MVPLLIKPILIDELWGGTRLNSEFFGFDEEPQKIAAAYMLSDMRGFKSIVKSGQFAGQSLHAVIKQMGVSALGNRGKNHKFVPLTVKLLDVSERLSVQVCPDDEYALTHDGTKSSSKLWYIADCTEESRLVYGFRYPTDKNEIQQRIQSGTLFEICNSITPKKGDVYLITPGTVHTAGKGLVIAEIRGGSDVSYRLTDYGRTASGGKPRLVRTKDALEVINTDPVSIPEKAHDIMLFPFGTVQNLAHTDEFITDLLSLNGNAGLCEKESFMSLLMTSGEAIISYVGGVMSIKKGDSVFLPANVRVIISGKGDILCTHL